MSTIGAALGLVVAASVVLAVVSGEPASASFHGVDGKIVFGSNRTGSFDIWVMNADGSGQTDLTADVGNDQTPRWSPDGTQIAFSSDRGGGRGIFVMTADGGGVRRITTGSDYWPAWTADGSKIVFNRDGEIHSVNPDGGGLTDLTNNGAKDDFPATSATSDLIAFRSDRTGNGDIYVMHADGSGVRQITSGDADDTFPNWSPVANEVEFVRDWLPNGDLFRVNVDNGAESRVTSTPERIEGDAAWAPSGGRIVFTGCYTGLGCQIFTINPDGSGEKQLTVAGGYSYSPDWQALPTQKVTVQKLGSGSGSVRDATGSLDCGGKCSASFTRGDHVQLEAVPASDSIFKGWSTAVWSNTSLNWSLTVEADTTVTAVFVKKQAILTVRKVGSGPVTSRPAGIACGQKCRFAFAPSVVTLTAQPTVGWRLTRWQDACSGTTRTCRLTLDRSTTIVVRFTRVLKK